MKNIVFTIEKEEELLSFLYSHIDKPNKEVKSLLVHGKVFVQNKVITKYNYLLKKGMEVIVYFDRANFTVLYEDEAILVIDKIPGITTIATEKSDMSMYRLVSDYMKIKNKQAKIYVVHRLDKETSGILIFAKSEKYQQILQDNWDSCIRKYIAVVNGEVNRKENTITSYLEENQNHMVYSSKTGKLAITYYKVVKTGKNYTWLDIDIKTGRKNQIRVHLKEMGNIIRGDKKYGDKTNQKRMYLHAYSISFSHPVTHKVLTIKSVIPKEFEIQHF